MFTELDQLDAETQPSSFSSKVLDFSFVNHFANDVTSEQLDDLRSGVDASDIVFMETVGWSEAEQSIYNQVSQGNSEVYRSFLQLVRNTRGKNSFAEARLKALRDSGKPMFFADADENSRAKKDNDAHQVKKVILKPSLSASLSTVRTQLTVMARGIDERHETAVNIINSNFGSDDSKSRAFIIYGGAHTGLERALKSCGYQTEHTFQPSLPVVFDYRSQVLRKLEYGIEPTREDWLRILAQNIVESVSTLDYPKETMLILAQRAVAESLSESDVARLNKAGYNGGNSAVETALEPLEDKLQKVISAAEVKGSVLITCHGMTSSDKEA